MDYEEKYKEALERAKDVYTYYCDDREQLRKIESIFPELKESEDGKIIKWLIAQLELKSDANNPHDLELMILKSIDWLEKQGKQKPINNTEPKFHEGEWCIDNEDGVIFQIVKVLDNTYKYRTIEGKEYSCTHYSLENDAKLWTIANTKDGDVLYSLDSNQPFIYKERKLNEQAIAYCGLNIYGKFFVWGTKDCVITLSNYVPATKEQRGTLFAKMKEAGYEWDAEKKELKKIEEEYNGEDYGIDSLFHAQRILEETLGKVTGYQSDDGILEHKCAISAIKKLYKKKPVEWHREDEQNLNATLSYIDDEYLRRWLKDTIYNKYEKPAEWSEADEHEFQIIQKIICDSDTSSTLANRLSNWLKSLKERIER